MSLTGFTITLTVSLASLPSLSTTFKVTRCVPNVKSDFSNIAFVESVVSPSLHKYETILPFGSKLLVASKVTLSPSSIYLSLPASAISFVPLLTLITTSSLLLVPVISVAVSVIV